MAEIREKITITAEESGAPGDISMMMKMGSVRPVSTGRGLFNLVADMRCGFLPTDSWKIHVWKQSFLNKLPRGMK